MSSPRTLLPLLLLGALPACASAPASGDPTAPAPAPRDVAIPAAPARIGERTEVELTGASGAKLRGRASFTEVEGGVLVELELQHAAPGWHAVHVHAQGDCSGADAGASGAHFDPDGKPHGSPHATEHHAGDLGNVWVDAHGQGRHVILVPELAVAPGPRSVRGRALVVHAGADDLTTQPAGNSGPGLGCGVIP